MSNMMRAAPDRPSEPAEDGREWVPREIAETPDEAPLFRRFAPTITPEEPSAPKPPTRIRAAAPAASADRKPRIDGIDAEVARRLELAEESIAESGRAVERSALALAELIEPHRTGRAS